MTIKKEQARWLQIKGDPSVRGFVFQQQRVESIFDQHLDELLLIASELLRNRGVFHAKIHFSSNQLTCWLYEDPYRYQVYVGDEVFSPGFLEQFKKSVYIEKPVIKQTDIENILKVFRRLRLQDESLYLRNASINLINGKIGMTFSCDGSHYIDFSDFYETVELLWTNSDNQ
jgi:hypothetical protein